MMDEIPQLLGKMTPNEQRELLELLEWLAGTGSSMRTSSGGKQQGASRQALRLRLRLK